MLDEIESIKYEYDKKNDAMTVKLSGEDYEKMDKQEEEYTINNWKQAKRIFRKMLYEGE
jgi:hypothetical protein